MFEIILASLSPYRAQLLHQIGLKFKAQAPLIDEEESKKLFTGTHKKLAEYLAFEKAMSLQKKYPESTIIGSDQVLLFKNNVLSKPKTQEEVIERLSTLQGQTHTLVTALCVLSPQHKKIVSVEAHMTMYPLSPMQIQDYFEKDQAIGCAGGYKIESHGPLLFEKIQTEDYFSIIGLPLLSLIAILKKNNPEML